MDSSSEKVKLYVDDGSQPSRAIMIFWELNNIPYEKVNTRLAKRDHLAEEFKKINPIRQVPAMKDGDFWLSEGHAIMKYLHSTRKWEDHWYPADIKKRALVDVYLDFHHWFLRQGAAGLVFRTVFAPMFGLKFDQSEIDNARRILDRSLDIINSVFLGSTSYLWGDEMTIADISSFSEIYQLEFIEEDLSKYPNLKRW